MGTLVAIVCPSCGKRAEVEQSPGDRHDNDDNDVSEMPAPDGFRKVQFGWSSDVVNLCCVSCGVPSHRVDERE